MIGYGTTLATLAPAGDSEKARAARRSGMLLRAGALLIPLGFALGPVAPHEGDPGWPVFLVPVVSGLIRAAWQAWRDP